MVAEEEGDGEGEFDGLGEDDDGGGVVGIGSVCLLGSGDEDALIHEETHVGPEEKEVSRVRKQTPIRHSVPTSSHPHACVYSEHYHIPSVTIPSIDFPRKLMFGLFANGVVFMKQSTEQSFTLVVCRYTDLHKAQALAPNNYEES